MWGSEAMMMTTMAGCAGGDWQQKCGGAEGGSRRRCCCFALSTPTTQHTASPLLLSLIKEKQSHTQSCWPTCRTGSSFLSPKIRDAVCMMHSKLVLHHNPNVTRPRIVRANKQTENNAQCFSRFTAMRSATFIGCNV